MNTEKRKCQNDDLAIFCDTSTPVALAGQHRRWHPRGVPHQTLAHLRTIWQVEEWHPKMESQFLWTSPFFRFSFASKTFRPEQEKKSTQSPARTIGQETTSLVFTIFHDYDLIYEITMEVIGFIFIWCLPSIMSLSWSWCQLSLQSFIIWHWLRLSLSSRRLKPRARELSWGVVMPPRSSTR